MSDGTNVLLQEAIATLKLIPRNVICFLSSSQEKHHHPRVLPQGSIPPPFFFLLGNGKKFVLIALKIPVVSSYFVPWWKCTAVFFFSPLRSEQEISFSILVTWCYRCDEVAEWHSAFSDYFGYKSVAL